MMARASISGKILGCRKWKKKKLDRSPAFPTSEDFIYDHKIRSNEIIRTKWLIYEIIINDLIISSECKKSI